MKTKHLPNNIKILLMALGLCAWGAASAFGQNAVYAARVASTSTSVWDSPFYWIANAGSAYATSTGKSNATNPVSTPTRVGCYFHTTSTMAIGEGYGLIHANGTAVGDGKNVVYEVDVTVPSSNVALNTIMNVGSTNCDIGGVFGATSAGGFTNTTAFQSAHCANVWGIICYLTNRVGVTKPHIDFKLAGVDNEAALRNYADCIYFKQFRPCDSVGKCGILGPVSTNVAYVTVTGVTNASDQAVFVYQKEGNNAPTVIGQLIGGIDTIVVGNNVVPVTWDANSLNATVVASQVAPSGQESCVDFPGYVVGGGANPRIRTFLNCKTSPGNLNAGPVGATGDTASTPGLFFMPGTASAVVPGGGILVNPSTNWQTIVIDPRTVTKSFIWSGTGSGGAIGAAANVGTWCTLEGIDFQMDDTTDTGPFDVLIDNVYSGPDPLVNFETDWAGGTYNASTGAIYQVFLKPSYTGFPVGQFEGPDSFNVVSNVFAVSGTNVGEWKWQFSGGNNTLWIRNLMDNGANWNYPQIHMDAPFQFDILLLPKGATQAYAVGSAPPLADATNCPATPFTVAVNVTAPVNTTTGTPLTRNYTYQWKKNGTAIGTATQSSYTIASAASTDSGTYSVVVGDGSGNTLTRQMVLTVPTAVQIDSQPLSHDPVPGDGSYHAMFLSVSASIPGSCPCENNPAIAYQWLFNGAPLTDDDNIVGSTTSGLTINTVWYTNAGLYTCRVTNTCSGQSVTSAGANIYVTPNGASPIANCGTGLLGLYWTNQTSANAFTGPPTFTNLDSQVNFDWALGGPTVGIYAPTDYFAVRWIATFQPPYDPGAGQTYTFYTTTDDGVRLWVNGQLLINHWAAQAATTYSGSIVLTTNHPVPIIMEYFEQQVSAVAELSCSSLSVASNIISQVQLCAADPNFDTPPFITLTAPLNNSTGPVGTPINLTAAVTQESATVDNVKFYNGASLLATVTQTGSGNYTASWTPPAAGVYNISAQALYNGTNTLNAATVNKFTATAPLASSVTISNTVNNGDGTITINYGGGAGSQFILVNSASMLPTRDSWTAVKTNTATPGSFTVTPAADGFYSIKSK